jgi:cell division protein FtsZ
MNMTMPETTVQRTPIHAKAPVLKVIGLGGGGSNAVDRMIELGLRDIEFIAANTDSQALENSNAETKIQLGPKLTRGLGAGGDPKIGEAAAEESLGELKAALAGADMVFLTTGMGGGTGTGAIPIASRVAHSLGAVTISIVTMPFSFEMGRRQKNAQQGISALRKYSDTLIGVPNDKLLQAASRNLPIDTAFRMADDVLRQGIQGITELITQPGLINVDFSHIRYLIQAGGGSLLSMGMGTGPEKSIQAVRQALSHPLLDAIPLENATGIIANFSGGSDLTFIEVAEALSFLQEQTSDQVDIIPGVIPDDKLEGRVQVILVITGIGATPIDAHPINQHQETNPIQDTSQEVELVPDLLIEEGTTAETDDAPVLRIEASRPNTNPNLPAFIRRRLRTM